MAAPPIKKTGKGRKAQPKPASEPAQGPIGNTGGVYVPVPQPNLSGGPTKIPIVAESAEEKGFLEKKQESLQKGIDDWVANQGDSKLAMAGGALATALNQVFFPTAWYELIPAGKALKLVKKSKEGIEAANKARKAEEAAKDVKKTEKAADMAKDAKKADANSGGTIHGKKRKPSRRCELVPYDELQCEEGQEAHHVVPDWMLRLGKRGGAERINSMPSLAKGPAICLEGGSGKEHNTAHKHTDKPAQRIAKNGTSTGTPGTLKLGQAKAISSRAIEKATGGTKGGGCAKDDIQKQLNEQFKAHNDTPVRGVRDAKKVTEAVRKATGKNSREI
jgi:hypothetical protein